MSSRGARRPPDSAPPNGAFDDVFLRDRDTDDDGVLDEPDAVSTERLSLSADFAGANASLNSLVNALGAPMQIFDLSDAPGFTTTTNIGSAPPWIDGVTSVGYSNAGWVFIAPAAVPLLHWSSHAPTPFVALAPVGAGDLVLGADINWISDHNDGAYTTDDNARLADNLC